MSYAIGARSALYGAGGWSPLRLFSNGEQGTWYDPSDLSTLFQDAAGTTPVTTDGDPVGLMLDKSGNGNHAFQSLSARRPTFREGGGLRWLKFDGVDDMLMTASIDFTATDKMTIGSGLTKVDASTRVVYELSTDLNSNAGSFYFVVGDDMGVNGLTSWGRGTGQGRINRISAASGTYVVSATHDIPNNLPTIRANGVNGSNIIGSSSGDGPFGNYPLYIGARAVGWFWYNGNIHSFIIRGALPTGNDLTKMESYIATKTGVTL